MVHLPHHRRKRSKAPADDKERAARIKRGPGVDVKRITDKKLKGKLRHAEKLYKDAQAKAIKANEWLLPTEAGYLQAEGTCHKTSTEART